MAKRNLFKGIVCELMLTAVVGTGIVAVSAAQAGTITPIKVSNGDFVLNVEDYYDTYDGTYGNFYVAGDIYDTSIEVVNDTYATRAYQIEVYEYNHMTGTNTDRDVQYVRLGVYGTQQVSVPRDFDYPAYRYDHLGTSYYSTESTSVIIDSYECRLYQYN